MTIRADGSNLAAMDGIAGIAMSKKIKCAMVKTP